MLDIQFSSGRPRRLSVFEANLTDIPEVSELELGTLNLNHVDLCPKCGGQHTLKKCEQFYLLSHKDRRSFVVGSGRCLCCLGTGHRWEQCYSKARCAICSEKHHLLVHDPDISEEVTSKPTFYGYCTSNILVCYNTCESTFGTPDPHRIDARPHLVATAFVVVAVRNPITGKTILINALCDTGANNSTISAHVASLLLLDGDPETYIMEVSGGDLKKYRTKYCFLEIGDEKGKEFIELGVRVLPRPCGSLRHLDWNSVKHHFPHFSKSIADGSGQPGASRYDYWDRLLNFVSSYRTRHPGEPALASDHKTDQIGKYPDGCLWSQSQKTTNEKG